MHDLDSQKQEVDALLKKGVWFSIFWLLGFGSFIAVRNAFKARQIIKRSDGKIPPDGRVMWCFIVGGLGFGFWLFVIVMGIINNNR